ncbi:sorting nexin-16 isoform X2 [Castor canadensis]|uniref:Sorting nexin-16 isoform X2 n=1 Tax=Castor canadensis TaxID=51338 RepID=A0AC58M655_CASCN
MATPYVPVPMSIGNSASSFTTSRNQRSSSFGSVSTSSNSSKGQLEDSNMSHLRQTSVPDQMDSTSSVCSSPLIRTKFTGTDSSIEYSTRPRETEEQNPETVNWEDRPSTPTILGYEVMEERAKFTVYKILVKKTPEESWVVFRRYTDFSRLNDKLKEMFPGFRLALPPKRWFKDNYNADFLEDRQLGLQAFLQNLVAHKDIANCLAVREFLCLDDPPGPFDSLEESRIIPVFGLEAWLKRLSVKLWKRLITICRKNYLKNKKRTLSLEPKESLYVSGTDGGQLLRVESSTLEVDHGVLDEESRANSKAHLNPSEPESATPEIEVAELAYNGEED